MLVVASEHHVKCPVYICMKDIRFERAKNTDPLAVFKQLRQSRLTQIGWFWFTPLMKELLPALRTTKFHCLHCSMHPKCWKFIPTSSSPCFYAQVKVGIIPPHLFFKVEKQQQIFETKHHLEVICEYTADMDQDKKKHKIFPQWSSRVTCQLRSLFRKQAPDRLFSSMMATFPPTLPMHKIVRNFRRNCVLFRPQKIWGFRSFSPSFRVFFHFEISNKVAPTKHDPQHIWVVGPPTWHPRIAIIYGFLFISLEKGLLQ